MSKYVRQFLITMLVFLMGLGVMSPGIFALENNDDFEDKSVHFVDYTSEKLVISVNDEVVNAIDMYREDRVTVSCEYNSDNSVSYQWQIELVNQSGVWIDIYNANKEALDITYGLIGNMLVDNSTKIRCVVSYDDITEISRFVTVNVVDRSSNVSYRIDNNIIEDNDGEDSTPEFVTVSVKYPQYCWEVNDNGEFTLVKQSIDAFTSYVAVLQYGSSFVKTGNDAIVPPQIVGYTPYRLDSDNIEDLFDSNGNIIASVCEKVEINETSVTSNLTYTVVYLPSTNTKYQVRYFFQNIYNDLYVEDTSIAQPILNATGTTGRYPDASYTKAEFDGFTPLFFEPEVIAADGSTVFNVYYERNYYLMEIDNNGGFGADTVYVRYGEHVSVANPVRTGYKFVGWDLSTDVNYKGDDVIPTIMPARNSKYIACWEKADTTYTAVYWIEEDGGTKLIGSSIKSASAEEKVSGIDDIRTSLVCGVVEHEHTAECIVCDNPEHISHEHNESCYGYATKVVNEKITTGNDWNVIQAANNNITPQAGYLYFIYTQNDINNNEKWQKMSYIENGNLVYYTVSIAGSNKISNSNIPNYVVGEKLTTAQVNGYYVDVYKAKTTCDTNRHTDECIKCGKTEHTHNSNMCLSEFATDVIFTRGDTDVTVSGDGSTIVNVYYRHMRYTLRYYYAKSVVQTNGSLKYYVVGGTTWPFGTYNSSNENTSVLDLLKNVSNSEWGEVQSIPELKDEVQDKYVTGTLVSDSTTYYYFEFTTYYGAHIENIWPVDIFEPVLIVGEHDQCPGLDMAYFSAWNGEYRVKYSQDHKGGNETIKGIRFYVDEDIVFDPKFSSHSVESYTDTSGVTSCLVSYLCFWDNGVENSWSIPRKYTYKLYLKNGDLYTEYRSYVVYDDNEGTNYTIPYIYGYEMESESCVKTVNGNYSQQKLDEYVVTINYSAAPYKLVFWNHSQYLTNGSGSKVLKDTPLGAHGNYVNKEFMMNHYPDSLEVGAYEFEGWYLSADFSPESKITDWASMKMPANDLMVYAHWVPKEHNVYFYEDYSKVGTDEYWYQETNSGTIPESYPIVVEHGTLIEEVYRTNPTHDDSNYTFVGWFYMDEGSKKRFAPNSMQIKKDLHLFAEWQTSLDAKYEITYVLNEDTVINGVTVAGGTPVASSYTGHITAGKTKTFTAKIAEELFEEYQNVGLFPLVNSHSLLMEPSEDNKYEFKYQIDDHVWYRVRYVDKITGLDISFPESAEKTLPKESTAAIVTEKFVPIEGYIPEDYYIRKVLASDGTGGTSADIEKYNNEIIFYYIPDIQNGLYTIEYYTQDVGNATYTLESSEINTVKLGTTKTVNIADIRNKFEGYEFARAEMFTYEDGSATKHDYGATTTQISGQVTKNGLEIKIYYNRKSYPYTIKYLEYGKTDVVLHTSQSEALYLDKVTHNAPDTFDDGKYLFYEATGKPQSQSITIGTMGNEMIFYYVPKEVAISYKAICLVSGSIDYGVVTLNYESVKTNETAQGASAIVGKGYEFLGWYTDEECTTSVNGTWLDSLGVKLTPNVSQLSDKNSVTYYALFMPMYGKLKITNTVNKSTSDSFLFKVQGKGKLEFITLFVTIQGTGSAILYDLPVGEYEVTAVSDWCWKYTSEDVDGNVKIEDKNSFPTIDFSHNAIDVDWLNDEEISKNRLN